MRTKVLSILLVIFVFANQAQAQQFSAPNAEQLSSIIEKTHISFEKCSKEDQKCVAEVVNHYYGPSTNEYMLLATGDAHNFLLMLRDSFLDQIKRTADKEKWTPWAVKKIDLPGVEVPTGLETHMKENKDELWIVPFIYFQNEWKTEPIEPHDVAQFKATHTKQ